MKFEKTHAKVSKSETFSEKKMKKFPFLEKYEYLLPVGGKNYYDYKNKYRNY